MTTHIKSLFDPDSIDVRLHVDGEGDLYLYAASGGNAVSDFLDADSFLAAVITEFGADRIREALGDTPVETESSDHYHIPRDYNEAVALWDSLSTDTPEFYSEGEVWMSEPRGATPFSAFTVSRMDGDRAVSAERRLYAAPKAKRPEWADALVIRGRVVEEQHMDDEQYLMRASLGADLFICQSGCAHKPENLANVKAVMPAEA